MIDGADTPWIAAPGEELCLDFANTRYWRGTAEPREELRGFAELVAWCAAKTGLPAARAEMLAAWAAAEPAAAVALRTEAIELREAIYRLFYALAEKSAPLPVALAWLNRALAAVAERRAIAATEAGFGWRVGEGAPGAMQLLTPVLWSAGDLLVGKRLAKVRHCANPDCEWLFIDDSKSGNRRWCSMSACGNRAKAHRHYARKKGRAV
ncbi:MAG TPA: CGNR zinc finger domain-containing protein [Stellaceae bacterium]|nr:CGNR zinc finger domain-containing protein [Stellaceae bacterium]